ncbi:hypothetical protein CRUP_019710 [Coryphaenoides rupestris]|nr:hypothetical protein CRUP_019710 [Coryphaenoides rupestris]
MRLLQQQQEQQQQQQQQQQQHSMWMHTVLTGLIVVSCCESRRNALQDYQTTEGIGLTAPPADPFRLSGCRTSRAKCAKACSRGRRFPFTCRAFVYDQRNRTCQWLSFDRNSHAGLLSREDSNYQLYQKKDYVRECIVGTGVNYRGQRSVTVSGIRCQAWDSSFPHEHMFMSKGYRKSDLRDRLCRNPDRSPAGPWCFTTDTQLRHQDCGVPQCSQVECVSCNGEDYRGPMDHTHSGKECQRWDLQEPHKHLHQPKRFPDKGLDDNLCRNPDGRHRPWCYTTDPHTPWEYCDIRVCADRLRQTENRATRCKVERLQLLMQQKRLRRKARRDQRAPYQWPANRKAGRSDSNSSSLSSDGAASMDLDFDDSVWKPDVKADMKSEFVMA